MSEPAYARFEHLAPVRYVSTYTGTERHGLLATSTTAAIPRLGALDAAFLGVVVSSGQEGGTEIYDTADGLFAALRTHRPQTMAFEAITEAEFLAWASLTGGFPNGRATFRGTPFVPWNDDFDLCAVVNERTYRSLPYDGRSRASVDLAAYVADDLRLYDGRVLHRLRGPYVTIEDRARQAMVFDTARMLDLEYRFRLMPMMAAPSDADGLLDFLHEEGVEVLPAVSNGHSFGKDSFNRRILDAAAAHRGRTADRELDDHAFLLTVGWYRDARRIAEANAGLPRGEQAAALAGLCHLLRTGRPTRDETEKAITLVREVVAGMEAAGGRRAPKAGFLKRYLDRLVLPRLVPVMPSEDVDALAGLVP